MEKSKVYYSDLRTTSTCNLPTKFERLIKKAGIETINFDKHFTAIKMHFGEMGNLAYLRPNYARVVVDTVKKLGGRPFLTDCNTLYVGSRKNALEHLDTAYINGFSPFSTNCHVIIADGIKGTDEAVVPIEGGEYIKEARIGQAIMDADIVISLSHFKGHEMTGFGGAIKNIGMGCGSRAGKMAMHSAGKPFVREKKCIGCALCTKNCAHGAITITDKKASIDHDKCVGCGRCLGACPHDAIRDAGDESAAILNKKMVEYTKAVLEGRPHFHISLVIDVSPYCDCHAENDAAIVPDIGMFASFDPIALDVACADAVNSQPINPHSMLAEVDHKNHDHFSAISPITDWTIAIDHAVKMGIGNRDYELIQV